MSLTRGAAIRSRFREAGRFRHICVGSRLRDGCAYSEALAHHVLLCGATARQTTSKRFQVTSIEPSVEGVAVYGRVHNMQGLKIPEKCGLGSTVGEVRSVRHGHISSRKRCRSDSLVQARGTPSPAASRAALTPCRARFTDRVGELHTGLPPIASSTSVPRGIRPVPGPRE